MQRFALISAGFIGSVHAANLAAHPDVDFALVHDAPSPPDAASPSPTEAHGSSTEEIRYLRTSASRMRAWVPASGPEPRNAASLASDSHRS